MKIPVSVNFNDPAVPENARLIRPLVWQDENSYCVLLGPDPQNGIFGCGDTVTTALKKWDQQLKNKLSTVKKNEAIAQFIRESMNASVYTIH
jgi:hypothetical protein